MFSFDKKNKPEEVLEDAPAVVSEQEDELDPRYAIRLKKPIKLVGKECSVLEFDFDELTAKDMHIASKKLKEMAVSVTIMALDYDYQMMLFLRAAKKRMNDIEWFDLMRLSAEDATKVTALSRNFLLNKDPEQSELGSDE